MLLYKFEGPVAWLRKVLSVNFTRQHIISKGCSVSLKKTLWNVNPTVFKVLNRLKAILRPFYCKFFYILQRLKNPEIFLRDSGCSEMNTTHSLYYLATWKLNFMFDQLKIEGRELIKLPFLESYKTQGQ